MIFDPLYITYALVVIVVLLILWILRLQSKLSKFLFGKDAKSLEDSILESYKHISILNQFQKDSTEHLINIEKRLGRSIQSVETIRFNPFKGTGEGGSQSFSTSFLSEDGKGVVVSSLYSRDRISIFSKPLEKFESQFELTDEEKEVIKKSKENLKK